MNIPVEFVDAATTGLTPVNVYVIPVPFAGEVTVTDPVLNAHVG